MTCGFNSRPSCDGRPDAAEVRRRADVSIHARRATGDRGHAVLRRIRQVSIHARHATGDRGHAVLRRIRQVSIHARHATGDIGASTMFAIIAVSIHARHATGDERACRRRRRPPGFQFTPVMRRATRTRPCRSGRRTGFNSRPSCDGRLRGGVFLSLFVFVSIHARHATGDLAHIGYSFAYIVSIHARHATGDLPTGKAQRVVHVSIHARHATGDQVCTKVKYVA